MNHIPQCTECFLKWFVLYNYYYQTVQKYNYPCPTKIEDTWLEILKDMMTNVDLRPWWLLVSRPWEVDRRPSQRHSSQERGRRQSVSSPNRWRRLSLMHWTGRFLLTTHQTTAFQMTDTGRTFHAITIRIQVRITTQAGLFTVQCTTEAIDFTEKRQSE